MQKESGHFELQELSPGVHAAVAKESGWAICNSGVVDLGDHLLVFDTFCNHIAAEDLRKAAEQAAGRPVDHVLLSHVHRDHVKGTQAFKEAVVVSTRWTAETMAKRWKERTEMVKRDGLDQIRTGVNGEFDAWESNELTDVADRVLWEGYRQAILQGLADYDLKLPSVGFEGSLVFQGAKKTAEAISFGGGHTESDALLYLPVERVAFLGDLLFTKCQPYIGDSNSKELLRVLDKVEALDCKVLVPGHGPVGTNRDIGLTREYIFALEKVVREKGRAEALKTKAPPPFDTWNLKAFWRENLESMMSSGPQT